MKNILWWVFVLIFLALPVMADQTCYIDETCEFSTIVYNTTQNYFNGTVTNTLSNVNGSLIYEAETMTQVIADGQIFYRYNYTFGENGTYLRESRAVGRIMNEQVTVKDLKNTDLASLVLGNWIWIVMIFLLLICFMLVLISKKNK